MSGQYDRVSFNIHCFGEPERNKERHATVGLYTDGSDSPWVMPGYHCTHALQWALLYSNKGDREIALHVGVMTF